MPTHSELEQIGKAVLARNPNDIVRLRVLRDVLGVPPDDPELVRLKAVLPQHRWVREVAEAQHEDGSWGRFHSQDTKVKARFPTSEAAVQRALALGLDADSPILRRAAAYMEEVLVGARKWADRPEKTRVWPLAVRLITAATLARIDPSRECLDDVWGYWLEVAKRSFASGTYDRVREGGAHEALAGVPAWSFLSSRYALALLGSRSPRLPERLDAQIVSWIWNEPGGIGYLEVNLRAPYHGGLDRWLQSLEILASYQSFPSIAAEAVDWLWKQRSPSSGLWDFGGRPAGTWYYPLSDSWRRAENREADYSTRVATFLRRCSAPCFGCTYSRRARA